MGDSSDIGRRLQAWCRQHGVTLQWVSKSTGIPAATLKHQVRGGSERWTDEATRIVEQLIAAPPNK